MSYQTASAVQLVSGGTGYQIGDTLTVAGGLYVPGGLPVLLTVIQVSAGVVTAVDITQDGLYSAIPASPTPVVGGHGVGLTVTVTWLSISSNYPYDLSQDSFPQQPPPGCPEQTANWTNPPNPAPTTPPGVRTTAALVQGIIQTENGVDLTPFITAANLLTTSACTYFLNPYSDGFINSQMELIERWLAAHFYTISDSQLQAVKAGSASVTFSIKIDYSLRASMYGQQALILDQRGGLAKINNSSMVMKKIRVGIWGPGRRRGWPGDVDGNGDWADLTVEQ